MNFYDLVPEVDTGTSSSSNAYSGVYRCRGLRRWCDERCDRYFDEEPDEYPEMGYYCELHSHQRPTPGAYVPSRMRKHLQRRTSFEAAAVALPPPAAAAAAAAAAPGAAASRAREAGPAASAAERLDALRIAAEMMLARGSERVTAGETVAVSGASVRVPRALRVADVQRHLVERGRCADAAAAQRTLERFERGGALRRLWRAAEDRDDERDLVRFACDYVGIVAIPSPPPVAAPPSLATASEDGPLSGMDGAAVLVEESSKRANKLLSGITGGKFGTGKHRAQLKSKLVSAARSDTKRKNTFDVEAEVGKRVLSVSRPAAALSTPATVRFAVVEAFSLAGGSKAGKTLNAFVRLAYRHRGALSLPQVCVSCYY